MDIERILENDWKILERDRQEVVDKITKLERRLNGLSEELNMKQLDQLKKIIHGLDKKIGAHRKAIITMKSFLEQRKGANTNKQLKQSVGILLRKRKQYFAHLNKINAKTERIKKQKQFIWELEAPIAQVEESFNQQITREECEKKKDEQVLDEVIFQVAGIKNNYNQTKKLLKQEIQELKERKTSCYKEMVRWFGQDREHLKWMLDNKPLYKDVVIHLYCENFPNDNLSDLIPKNSTAPLQKVTPAKTGLRQNGNVKPQTPKPNEIKSQEWEFFIISHKNDPGIKLPLRRKEFLTGIQPYLPKNVRGIKISSVYKKLVITTKMDMHQRQLSIKKIIEPKLRGCQSWPIGGYRLLIFINEDLRQIRFLLEKRNESYLKNH